MIWSLQILRFVAALLVVLVHAGEIAYMATGSNGMVPQSVQLVGRAGVDIFFVISGVIMSRIATGMTWQEFAWRRLCRILPIYLLVCIPVLLIATKTGFGWRGLLATVALWPATDVMTEPLLPVAWTLCFEMLFYAAVAAVIWRHRMFNLLIACYLLAFALRAYGPIFRFLGNPIIIEFLFGVALARLPEWRPGRWGVVIGGAALILAGPAGFAPDGGTLDFLSGQGAGWRVVVYGIPAALVVYGTMQFEAGPSIWTEQGDASYSLYLTHPLIASALLHLWMAYPIQPDAIIVLTTLACVIFGWRIHVRFEEPLLKALRRRRPAGTTPQPTI